MQKNKEGESIKMARLFSTRVWILIIALFLALLMIDPSPLASGVEIKHIESTSPALAEETDKLIPEEQEVIIKTTEGETVYKITSELGFSVDSNLTIFAASPIADVKEGGTLLEINGETIENPEEFNKIVSQTITKSNLLKLKMLNRLKLQFSFHSNDWNIQQRLDFQQINSW